MIKWAKGRTWDDKKYWCRGESSFGCSKDWEFPDWEVLVDPESHRFVLLDRGNPVQRIDQNSGMEELFFPSSENIWKTSWFSSIDEYVSSVEEMEMKMQESDIFGGIPGNDLHEE